MNNSNIASITLLRAIAALMVCFVHIQIIANFYVNSLIDSLIDNGRHGVEIFFVISGFILPYSLYRKNYILKDFFLFLLRRSARIDPPYWCIIALALALGVIPVSLISAKSLLAHLFYVVPFVKGTSWYLGVLWTLSFEFQFYLLLGIFFPFLIRINASTSILILIVVIIICLLVTPPCHGLIIEQMQNFLIGFIAFIVYVKRISLTKGVLILLLLSVYLMVAVSIKTGAIPLLTALFILFYKGHGKLQPLYFIGNISYSLYLIHMPVSSFIVQKIDAYFPNKLLLSLVCLLLSILSAHIFYLLIERYSLKLSKLIKLSR